MRLGCKVLLIGIMYRLFMSIICIVSCTCGLLLSVRGGIVSLGLRRLVCLVSLLTIWFAIAGKCNISC